MYCNLFSAYYRRGNCSLHFALPNSKASGQACNQLPASYASAETLGKARVSILRVGSGGTLALDLGRKPVLAGDADSVRRNHPTSPEAEGGSRGFLRGFCDYCERVSKRDM